ncbi:MAG TPA: allene oxide cyclase family protein [Bauldia sp.]|nr:allene oxide cyclase family protein [Bauldia sp.]
MIRNWIGGAAGVLAAAWVAGSAGQALAMDAMEKLTVVEHATSDAVTDIGDKGDSAGDILTFANEIYDEANQASLGTDNGWCIRTIVGKAWECFWTVMLKDGQITVEGPFLDAGDSMLAVTGGTGAYAGVRGDMKLHARNAQGSEYDFVYDLIR